MMKNFFKIVLGGFIGGICGALTGFLLMFLVRGLILAALFFTASQPIESTIAEPIAFLSIGAGTLVGAIFGAIFCLKKQNN
ncbi:MAG: hypothetical protein AAB444_01570 [Patescibacteria group bacterium]